MPDLERLRGGIPGTEPPVTHGLFRAPDANPHQGPYSKRGGPEGPPLYRDAELAYEHPLVAPQLGQAWHEPARCMMSPQTWQSTVSMRASRACPG